MLFSNEEVRVALPFYQTVFPKKLIAVKPMSMYTTDSEQIYTPLVKATADITFIDDDFAVGHCRCSNCKKDIDIFNKYCFHCGAKIIGRRDINA